jgi:hypothetical protein
MKPDWKDAPEWANWLAMDEDGEWFWRESKPTVATDCFYPGARWDLACAYSKYCAAYLEPRP